jgi:hypothetical protein
MTQTEAEPTKYWLSILPPDVAIDRLLDAIKLRWRIAPENMRTRR